MSSMLDTFINDEQEIGTDSKANVVQSDYFNDFAIKVKQISNRVISDYIKYKVDLNKMIAKIAQSNNLNNDQIQRIIEEVNCQIFLHEYNKQKDSLTRDVQFDIADINKIKDFMGNNTAANKQSANPETPENEEPQMKKKANVPDGLNFLNYSPYKTANLAEDKKTSKRSIVEKEVINKLASICEDYDATLDKYLSNMDTFVDSIIKYARLNEDCNAIFEKVCIGSGLLKKDQLVIKEAITEKVAKMKELKLLPGIFNCDLQLVDSFEKKADFSLGEHTFVKNASFDSLPTITTNKKTIKNHRDLISIAMDIKSDQENLLAQQHQRNNIEKMLQQTRK